MPFTTFDPTTVINATLSGSNLIATRTGIGGAKAAHGKRTGKWYWEMVAAGGFTSSNLGILTGIHTDYTQLVGNVPPAIGAVAVGAAAGQIYVNGVATGISVGAYFTAGGLLCFALDLDNRLIWVRLGAAGNWNGNAANNPATGIGGVSVAPVLGLAFYAMPAVCMSGAGTSCTANFGASAFTGTAPSGFVGWSDVNDRGLTNIVPTQTGVEVWEVGTPALQITQAGIEFYYIPNPNLQLTQLGVEAWASGIVDVQLTQIGVEVWAQITPANVIATQIGVEAWVSVSAVYVPQGGPIISMIM